MFLKWGVHKNNYESWCLKTNAIIVIIMQGAKKNHGHKPKKKKKNRTTHQANTHDTGRELIFLFLHKINNPNRFCTRGFNGST
jgi:hypothetical protein